jgi:acyl-homoserine-lactone acylase
VITRFEPWMALTFSEGSIGGDIERVSLPELQRFYEHDATNIQARAPAPPAEPTGSNGFAIAPARSASKHALLWINPHTSSGVDNIDEYAETVTPSGAGFVYAHGGEQRAVHERKVVVRYKRRRSTRCCLGSSRSSRCSSQLTAACPRARRRTSLRRKSQ